MPTPKGADAAPWGSRTCTLQPHNHTHQQTSCKKPRGLSREFPEKKSNAPARVAIESGEKMFPTTRARASAQKFNEKTLENNYRRMCWSYSLTLQLKGFIVLGQEISETRASRIGLHKSEKIPRTGAIYLHSDLNIYFSFRARERAADVDNGLL